MKKKNDKQLKNKDIEVDFTNVTPDDIARRFLETPPKPRKKPKKKD